VAYEIRYLQRERAVGTEPWDGSLEDARGLAKSQSKGESMTLASGEGLQLTRPRCEAFAELYCRETVTGRDAKARRVKLSL
jgi:hypothetical protein